MNYARFSKILLEKYPDVKVSPHAGYSNSSDTNAVGVCFREGGRVYEYSGSYTDILEKLGITRRWSVTDNGEIIARFYTKVEATSRLNKEINKQAEFLELCVSKNWPSSAYGTHEFTVNEIQ